MLGLREQVGGDKGGGGVSSAIIKTSDGPATESIPTAPKTCRLASATYPPPGPTILSARGIVFVP